MSTKIHRRQQPLTPPSQNETEKDSNAMETGEDDNAPKSNNKQILQQNKSLDNSGSRKGNLTKQDRIGDERSHVNLAYRTDDDRGDSYDENDEVFSPHDTFDHKASPNRREGSIEMKSSSNRGTVATNDNFAHVNVVDPRKLHRLTKSSSHQKAEAHALDSCSTEGTHSVGIMVPHNVQSPNIQDTKSPRQLSTLPEADKASVGDSQPAKRGFSFFKRASQKVIKNNQEAKTTTQPDPKPKNVSEAEIVKETASKDSKSSSYWGRIGGEQSKFSRLQSRSISSYPSQMSKPMLDAKAQPHNRSKSLRIAPTTENKEKEQLKPRKLLRDISFSDGDEDKVKNFGALRGGIAIPARIKMRLGKANVIVEEEANEADAPVEVPFDMKAHLLSVLQELLDRGKILNVAVLEQNNNTVLASLPTTWKLTRQDEIGLVKAVVCTQQMMLKLNVDGEIYTCMKHGSDKIVGRTGDKIMVIQKTDTCVVVGVSNDEVPGSCVYEVSELTKTLRGKGW